MIKTTLAEIKSMLLLPNRVIIKPTRGENELLLSDGKTKIYISADFAHEQHTPTTGKIINICPNLDCSLMRWETELEAKVHDFVVFSYEASIFCYFEDNSRLLFDEYGQVYLLIDYEDLFTVKRDEQVIPLNGYLLCSPIADEIKTTIILPQTVKKRKSAKFAKIEYVGNPNKLYYDGTGTGTINAHYSEPTHTLLKGDVIVFDKNSDLPLEFDIHQSLLGRNRQFFRIQRCNIKGVLREVN